jgi:hypothetical protein
MGQFQHGGSQWFNGTFLGLNDTPATYTAGDKLIVNAGGTAVTSEADTFLTCADTPAAYAGASLQLVRVNVGETGLEFAAGFAGNTLDAAYDEGGAGVGRAITVDTGAVELDLDATQAGGSTGLTLDVGGVIPANQTVNGIHVQADDATAGAGETYHGILLDNTSITTGGTIDCINAGFPISTVGANFVAAGTDTAGNTTQGIDIDLSALTLNHANAILYGAQIQFGALTNTLSSTVYGLWVDCAAMTLTTDPTNFAGIFVEMASGDAAIDIDSHIRMEEDADPTTPANHGALYCKDDNGTTELFFREDGSGTVYQITPTTFLNLTDTPATFPGTTDPFNLMRVNEANTAIEFISRTYEVILYDDFLGHTLDTTNTWDTTVANGATAFAIANIPNGYITSDLNAGANASSEIDQNSIRCYNTARDTTFETKVIFASNSTEQLAYMGFKSAGATYARFYKDAADRYYAQADGGAAGPISVDTGIDYASGDELMLRVNEDESVDFWINGTLEHSSAAAVIASATPLEPYVIHWDSGAGGSANRVLRLDYIRCMRIQRNT